MKKIMLSIVTFLGLFLIFDLNANSFFTSNELATIARGQVVEQDIIEFLENYAREKLEKGFSREEILVDFEHFFEKTAKISLNFSDAAIMLGAGFLGLGISVLLGKFLFRDLENGVSLIPAAKDDETSMQRDDSETFPGEKLDLWKTR